MLDAAGYQDRIARLRLIRTPTIGPVTYYQLLARFGTAEAALDAVPDLARRGGGRPPALATRAAVDAEVAQVERLGARYLFRGAGLYPPLLGEIEAAPPALIVKGRLALLEKPAVAVVGARYAAEYGRDVMAVPGSPLDPRAQGCNLLIRDGATLVQNAADVIEALGPYGGGAIAQPGTGFAGARVSADADDRDRAAIIDLLGPTPVPVDELIRQSGLVPAIVQTVLLELELAGRLARHAGGKVSLG